MTIIVPVYNSGKYIETCVKSLIKQSLKDIEMIFIDDGSTDDSYKILKLFEKQDTRVKVVRNQQNIGAAESRNIGLKLAKGKYVQFVDADDYLDETATEKIYKKMNTDDADICFIKLTQFTSSGNEEQVGIKGTYNEIYNGTELLSEFLDRHEFFLYLCSAVYSKRFIEIANLKFVNLKIGEGGDYILRALCNAKKVVVMNLHCYFYRKHADSVTRKENINCQIVLGQLIQYINILKTFSQKSKAKGIKKFLEYQYGKVYSGINNLSYQELQWIETILEDDYSKYIFKLFLQNDKTYKFEFNDNILNSIKEGKKIIIYGAGYATRDVILELNKYNAEIISIVVTEKKDNPDYLFGHPVKQIEDFVDQSENVLVLVAANKKYNDEIEENLKKHDFSNYAFLNITI